MTDAADWTWVHIGCSGVVGTDIGNGVRGRGDNGEVADTDVGDGVGDCGDDGQVGL